MTNLCPKLEDSSVSQNLQTRVTSMSLFNTAHTTSYSPFLVTISPSYSDVASCSSKVTKCFLPDMYLALQLGIQQLSGSRKRESTCYSAISVTTYIVIVYKYSYFGRMTASWQTDRQTDHRTYFTSELQLKCCNTGNAQVHINWYVEKN